MWNIWLLTFIWNGNKVLILWSWIQMDNYLVFMLQHNSFTAETVKLFPQVDLIWSISINKNLTHSRLWAIMHSSPQFPDHPSPPFLSPDPLSTPSSSPQSWVHTSLYQHLPLTPTLAAIIRGGVVLSPVSSTPPWISRPSARPCRPLSLTLTLSFCLASEGPRLTPPLFTPLPPSLAFRLMQPLCYCPAHIPQVPTLDLAPGLRPRLLCLCCPQHGSTYPRAKCGPMWLTCPDYRLSALILAIDFYLNLLPKGMNRWRNWEVRVDWAKEGSDEWVGEESRRKIERIEEKEMGTKFCLEPGMRQWVHLKNLQLETTTGSSIEGEHGGFQVCVKH